MKDTSISISTNVSNHLFVGRSTFQPFNKFHESSAIFLRRKCKAACNPIHQSHGMTIDPSTVKSTHSWNSCQWQWLLIAYLLIFAYLETSPQLECIFGTDYRIHHATQVIVIVHRLSPSHGFAW